MKKSKIVSIFAAISLMLTCLPLQAAVYATEPTDGSGQNLSFTQTDDFTNMLPSQLGESLKNTKSFTPGAFTIAQRTIATEDPTKTVGVLQVWQDYVSGKDSVNKAEMVYLVLSGTAFRVTSYCQQSNLEISAANGTPFILKLYGSADGNSYTELTVDYVRENITGPDAYVAKDTYTIASLPSNIRYVKIQYPNDKSYVDVTTQQYDSGVTANCIRTVEYNPPALTFDKTTDMIDTANVAACLSDVYSYTPSAFARGARGITFPTGWKAVGVLQLTFDYCAAASFAKPELVYLVKGGSDFRIKTYCTQSNLDISAANNSPFILKMYGSEDGINYSELYSDYSRRLTGESDWVAEDVYTVYDMPANVRFVKVQFPNDKTYMGVANGPDPIGQMANTIRSVEYTPPSLTFDKTTDMMDTANVAACLSDTFSSTPSAFDRGARGITFPAPTGWKAVGVLQLGYNYCAAASYAKPELVYFVKGGSDFRLTTYCKQSNLDISAANNAPFKLKLYGSSDGSTYSELFTFYSRKLTGESDWVAEDVYTVIDMPENIHFVKVQFPNDKTYSGIATGSDPIGQMANTIRSVEYSPQVLSFGKTTDRGTVSYSDFMAGAYSYTAGAFADAAAGLTTGAAPVTGLAWAYCASTTFEKPTLVYNVQGGTDFRVTTYCHKICDNISTYNSAPFILKLYTSADGVTYIPISTIYKRVGTGAASWLYKDTYTLADIPQDAQFVKIEFPNDKSYQAAVANVGNNANTIRSVEYSVPENITVSSASYQVDNVSGIIKNVALGTNAGNFLTTITANDNYAFSVDLLSGNSSVTSDKIMMTGMTYVVKGLYKNTQHTIAVAGDPSCDGAMDVCDLILMARYSDTSDSITLTDAQKAACDYTGDSSVTDQDVTTVQAFILNNN